jgi:hypothetical protein
VSPRSLGAVTWPPLFPGVKPRWGRHSGSRSGTSAAVSVPAVAQFFFKARRCRRLAGLPKDYGQGTGWRWAASRTWGSRRQATVCCPLRALGSQPTSRAAKPTGAHAPARTACSTPHPSPLPTSAEGGKRHKTGGKLRGMRDRLFNTPRSRPRLQDCLNRAPLRLGHLLRSQEIVDPSLKLGHLLAREGVPGVEDKNSATRAAQSSGLRRSVSRSGNRGMRRLSSDRAGA